MLSYLEQVAICDSVLEKIKRAVTQSADAEVRLKAHKIPTTDSILRAVTLFPTINTSEKLKDFIIEHVRGSLSLNANQSEHLEMNG